METAIGIAIMAGIGLLAAWQVISGTLASRRERRTRLRMPD